VFREGDIVQIPLPDGRKAVGWVLYVSEYFKNVLGFVVFGIEGEIPTSRLRPHHSMSVLGVLYTGVPAAEHYGWATIAHQALNPKRRALTRRKVADEVWVGDDCIGLVAQIADAENLPEMDVLGMRLVYEEIAEAFGPAGSASG
jgi:hypothetical protein